MTLEVTGVKVRYGPLEALHGVTLDVPTGSVTAILGRNGAGKTSLLRAVSGNVQTSDGRITWHGKDLTHDTVADRSHQGVMLIPDEGGVFRSLTVRENLELFATGDGVQPAIEAFPQLNDLLDRRAVLLSGGEQRMLALSRALLAPWRLLLIDELSHGLASALATRLYAVLSSLVGEDDRTVVVAEPHPRQALDLATHVHILRRGEVAYSGEPAGLDPDSL